MKRWSFLCFIGLFIWLSPTSLQASVSHTVPHPHHPITLDVFTSKRILIIEGRGQAVFSHALGDERYQYIPKAVVPTLEGFVIVGERLSRQEEQHYDIFIFRLNLQGDVLEESVFEATRNDAIKHVFVDEYTTMIHTHAQYIPSGEQDLIRYADKVYWIAYGDILETYEFTEEFTHAKQFGQAVALYLGHPQIPEVLILDQHHVLRQGQLRGVEARGEYHGEVTLQFVGSLWLNGRLFHTPVTLTEPGLYDIVFEGATFHFTLHPTIEGVTPSGLYKESLRIYYSAGQALLNEDLYYSGALIGTPGHHRLVFTAPNYHFEIPFTLTANVQGILDRQVYTTSKTITFQGEGYLNNTFITSPHEIKESGQYMLRVYGLGGYEETHNFTLQLEPQSTIDYWQIGEILLLSTSILCGLFFGVSHLLKKRQKTS